MPIEVRSGDITTVEVDVIVNSANTSLLGGGGVDGAIHKAAGPELKEECKELGGCEVGGVKATKGYNLKCKEIFHAAGPIWRGGNSYEDVYLENCYKNCMRLMLTNGHHSIAFPNISTGIYGFPKEKAAKIAIRTIEEFMRVLKKEKEEYTIIFVCFDPENLKLYQDLVA